MLWLLVRVVLVVILGSGEILLARNHVSVTGDSVTIGLWVFIEILGQLPLVYKAVIVVRLLMVLLLDRS